MRFTVAGSKIICSRIDNTVEGADKYRAVVEFDEHLDVVPPHVAARLTQTEIEDLEDFLADRKRIQASPAKVNMLEALPELLDEATEILGQADRLNEAMYRKLHSSIGRLRRTLDGVKPGEKGQITPVRSMRKSEELKERLESIKQDF